MAKTKSKASHTTQKSSSRKTAVVDEMLPAKRLPAALASETSPLLRAVALTKMARIVDNVRAEVTKGFTAERPNPTSRVVYCAIAFQAALDKWSPLAGVKVTDRIEWTTLDAIAAQLPKEQGWVQASIELVQAMSNYKQARAVAANADEQLLGALNLEGAYERMAPHQLMAAIAAGCEARAQTID